MPKDRCFKTRHVKGCRPGRPLCKLMRKVRPQRQPCYCDRYPYPHRKGSGRCGNIEQMWDYAYGPSWRNPSSLETEEAGIVAPDDPGPVPF